MLSHKNSTFFIEIFPKNIACRCYQFTRIALSLSVGLDTMMRPRQFVFLLFLALQSQETNGDLFDELVNMNDSRSEQVWNQIDQIAMFYDSNERLLLQRRLVSENRRKLLIKCGTGRRFTGFYCSSCITGQYQDETGHRITACKLCSYGQYTDQKGSSRCLSCQSTTTKPTSLKGAENIKSSCSCVAGSGWILQNDQDICQWCTPGTYSQISACYTCPEGQYQSTCGQTKCIGCPLGKTSTSDRQSCDYCSKGQYSDEIGGTCKTCPQTGFSCEDGIKLGCAPGKFARSGVYTCTNCAAGQYSTGAMASGCTLCQKGTYSEDSGQSTPCAKCFTGRYLNSQGATASSSCISCTTISSGMTTVGPGSKDEMACVCSPGTFLNPYSSNLKELCFACPEGANCPDTSYGETIYGLASKAGWWRKSYVSPNFHKCLHNDLMCKGARVFPFELGSKLAKIALSLRIVNKSLNVLKDQHNLSSVLSSEEISNNSHTIGRQCQLGYSGTLCKSCGEDYLYSLSTQTCIHCPAGKTDTMSMSLLITLFAFVFTLVLSILLAMGNAKMDNSIGEFGKDRLDGSVGSEEDVARNSAGGAHTRTVMSQILSVSKISAGFLQIISSMTFVFDLEWPPVVAALFGMFEFINFDFLAVFKIISPCGLSASYPTAFILHMVIIPLSCLCIVCAFFARYLFLKLRIVLSKICGNRCKGRFKVHGAIAALDVKASYENAKRELRQAQKKQEQDKKAGETNFTAKKEAHRLARENVKTAKKGDKKILKDLKAAVERTLGEAKLAKKESKKVDQKNFELVRGCRKKLAVANRKLKKSGNVEENLKAERKSAVSRMLKYFNLVLFIVYPGLTVRIFRLFKCQPVLSDKTYVMEASPDIVCYDEEWNSLMVAAIVFGFIYVIGIPLSTFVILRANKKALWDKKHPNYEYMMQAYGNLYEPYLRKYWYW